MHFSESHIPDAYLFPEALTPFCEKKLICKASKFPQRILPQRRGDDVATKEQKRILPKVVDFLLYFPER